MKYVRIYTGPDKLSHFENVEVSGNLPGTPPQAPWAAKSFTFGHLPSGYYHDWHPAPRRQFAITLSGETEITASDGESRRFGQGDVMLADDTTGKGHTSRVVGDQERVTVFVPLAD